MEEKTLTSRHVFVFNKQDNGGESLTLTTEFSIDELGKIHINQRISLQSYCNSASFELSGYPLSPNNLRELADKLESRDEFCIIQSANLE